MNASLRFGIVSSLVLTLLLPALAADPDDLRSKLRPDAIRSASIHLNASGARLGFETRIDGSDSRLADLIDVIRKARPGGGHKCRNAGSIRFWMNDGSVIGIGLLPSHTPGLYELRLYDGEHLLDAYRTDRGTLLAALADLGVPTDDPAFRE